MPKIITLGEILVEIMATERGQSFRRPGVLLGPYASGAPAIFIDQVARLGCPAAMIGCVGNDDFGQLNIDRLQADGADTRAIHRLDHAVTGSAFVTYREDGERDFIFNIRNSASALLGPEHVSEAALKDCTHFHVMGSSLFSASIVEAMKKAVGIVKAQGGTISFDPNIRKEILGAPGMRAALEHFLGLTDIFLPSANELGLLFDLADEPADEVANEAANEAEAVRRLLARGIGEIVIKRGALGCRHHDANGCFDVAALVVDEIDPTGAGDCFGATYVTCRQLGKPPHEALRYANAAGAIAVGRKGPMEGSSSFAELEALLAAQDA